MNDVPIALASCSDCLLVSVLIPKVTSLVGRMRNVDDGLRKGEVEGGGGRRRSRAINKSLIRP